MIEHTIGQQIVLGQHLSDWPEDKTFTDILLTIIDGDKDSVISIWEPFCEWDKEFFVDHIYDLSRAIDAAIKEITTP